MPEFRARLNIRPNSLTDNGAIVDWTGHVYEVGPCFVDIDKLSPARKALMGEAGWHRVNRAADYPGIPPNKRALCVVRIVGTADA